MKVGLAFLLSTQHSALSTFKLDVQLAKLSHRFWLIFSHNCDVGLMQ
ncbi:hypothetical protein H6G74_10805 [Nostoc spongiaeforme FACHB-130]|uniref:Uncharacterized protein n=1 Tax=Nostoc spongiaeforme FACHB-130 TaxID=1357510 RepID=A0ABR8FU59_9NOSO|nr:hypothetical protein [Nostoc spongiaeforme]MBD2594816.1 hypothetical protein [Nostoc spongiaeforme FACHB-130]